MSLKHSAETAFLAIIADSGLFPGQLLRSTEPQTTTKELPCIVAEYQSNGRSPSHAQELGTIVLTLISTGDRDVDEVDDPAGTHAADVAALQSILYVPNLATLLNNASENYTVLHILPASPPPAEVRDRTFRTSLAFELVSIGSDV